MKTEKEIRKKLDQLRHKRIDWFCDSLGAEETFAWIKVLKWVLKSKEAL
jgi:hypothetical protein